MRDREELKSPLCLRAGGWGKALAAGLLLGMVAACSTVQGPAPEGAQLPSPQAPGTQAASPWAVGALPAEGLSGMAALGDSVYLVVHDTKAHQDGPRVGLIQVLGDEGTRYQPLEIEDWKDRDGRSNDLEAACALPGRPGELLLAESGDWEGRYGRIFHLRVAGRGSDARAQVLAAYRLPLLAGNDREHRGDNFEGLACARQEEGRFLLLLGERGGSPLYPRGVLRWGSLDLDQGSLAWADGGRAGWEVAAPGDWPGEGSRRDISDLYLAPEGTLWAAAALDGGDRGPFRSVIYRLGRVTGDLRMPLQPQVRPPAAWTLDGLKVEALAAPAAAVPGSALSLGSEDESLGGVWRPLYPPRDSPAPAE